MILAGLHGLPKRSGKLNDISKFDATFFGVHPKQANGMDPQLRLLLEVTYEAIVDAGALKQCDFASAKCLTVGILGTLLFSCKYQPLKSALQPVRIFFSQFLWVLQGKHAAPGERIVEQVTN